MRLDQLDAYSCSVTILKIRSHWFGSFSSFLVQMGTDDANKLRLLQNYERLTDCSTFAESITVMAKMFIKPQRSCKQESKQNFSHFFQNLRPPAKRYNFKALSSEQPKWCYMWCARWLILERISYRGHLISQNLIDFPRFTGSHLERIYYEHPRRQLVLSGIFVDLTNIKVLHVR